MSCIGCHKESFCLALPEVSSPTYPRVRQSTPLHPQCPLSSSQAEELLPQRNPHPHLRPPDARPSEHVNYSPPSRADTAMDELLFPHTRLANANVLRETSPTSSPRPSPKPRPTPKPKPKPKPSSRDRRSRSAKARAQYARDLNPCCLPAPTHHDVTTAAGAPSRAADFGPKRQRYAFVQEQERKCLMEDRVGTPHASELQPGDDVSAQPNVDELGVGGEVAGLRGAMGGAAAGPAVLGITDIPDEGREVR